MSLFGGQKQQAPPPPPPPVPLPAPADLNTRANMMKAQKTMMARNQTVFTNGKSVLPSTKKLGSAFNLQNVGGPG